MSKYIYRYEPFGSLTYDNDNGEIWINKDLRDFDKAITRVIDNFIPNYSPISYPLTAFLEVTKRCNSKCEHCFNKSGTVNPKELTLNQWYNIIDDLYNNGIFSIKITGGEPFCRSDIFEIFDYIDQKKIGFIVFTNGKLVDEVCVDRLKKYKYLSCIRVSIDGKLSTNDSIRGEDAFADAWQAIQRLSNSNIPCEVNFTITKTNLTEIVDIADLIYKENLKCSINIGMIKVSGRATLHINDYFFNEEEITDAILEIKAQLHKTSIIKPYYLLQPIYFKIFSEHFGCPAGRLTVTINSEGSVFACGLFSDNNKFNCGNLIADNLLSIWRGEKMEYIRNLPERDECATCEYYKKKCTGGCRGNALNYFGDVCERDINCKLYSVDFND